MLLFIAWKNKRSYKLFFSNLFIIMNLHILHTFKCVQREPSKMFQNFGSLFYLGNIEKCVVIIDFVSYQSKTHL